ncbi:hypothetical protein ACPOL_4276 [Acidisarcina polymorpha]|uniref:DUF5666 domain-containing protein n=1 Tax=Acidisarcina polymorpha TaxID=2211140 RepID=A0A2Z5G340_9BACT|nr:hypothetical protein [Acidisarcina polymorpha]AXC13551.1 hypothetical protein ACPOL_4276 [Acidisarcina polymorpha]
MATFVQIILAGVAPEQIVFKFRNRLFRKPNLLKEERCPPVLSFRFLLTASTAALIVVAAALIAPSAALGQTPARVRGVITAMDDHSITLKDQGGRSLTLKTGAYTTYAELLPSSPDEIKIDDFVGAAVKGTPKSMIAVEVALVPKDMRAGRAAYYGWDALPDPTATHSSVKTPTEMTNGGVTNISETVANKLVDTKATRGAVSAKGGKAGRTLIVAYDGGSKTLQITVPANAPIVRYVLADRSALSIAAAVMIKTNPSGEAGLVSIGKEVIPPM